MEVRHADRKLDRLEREADYTAGFGSDVVKLFMRKTFIPAEVFPPGEFLREELQARGWTQSDLARVIGRPLQTVNQIINGGKRITVETAKELGLALGTGPEVWLNLENAYRLHTTPAPDKQIAKRAMALT
jgi:addiction module HigA family antidote